MRVHDGADVGPLGVGQLVHQELRRRLLGAAQELAVQVDDDQVVGLDEALVIAGGRDQHALVVELGGDVAVAGGDVALPVHAMADLGQKLAQLGFTHDAADLSTRAATWYMDAVMSTDEEARLTIAAL